MSGYVSTAPRDYLVRVSIPGAWSWPADFRRRSIHWSTSWRSHATWRALIANRRGNSPRFSMSNMVRSESGTFCNNCFLLMSTRPVWWVASGRAAVAPGALGESCCGVVCLAIGLVVMVIRAEQVVVHAEDGIARYSGAVRLFWPLLIGAF